jgi:hypothetical protein
MRDMPVALPCPFCGESDSFYERADYASDYRVCNKCLARGPIVEAGRAYEKINSADIMERRTINAWNRRRKSRKPQLKNGAKSNV